MDPIRDNQCTYIPFNIGAKYWTDGCLEKLESLAQKAGTVLSIILFSVIGVEVSLNFFYVKWFFHSSKHEIIFSSLLYVIKHHAF